MKLKTTKGQEEMVGFALIIIIVAVLILVFLSLSLNKHKEIEDSYEVRGFVQAFLQYTTDCAKRYETDYLDVWKLVELCNDGRTCYDQREACEVLETTFNDLLGESWKVGEDWPDKGYSLNITSEGEELFSSFKGNTTLSSKIGSQNLGDGLELRFTVYS